MMPLWCRQVNWGNCGIPWVNCAVLCVKDTGKDSSESYAIACQNCAVYSVFTSGMTSHSKIVQFNWQCIGRLKIYPGWCWFFQHKTKAWLWSRRYFQFRDTTFQEGNSVCTPICFRPQITAQRELFQPRGMHIWTWRVLVNLWECPVSEATCSCWNGNYCHNK